MSVAHAVEEVDEVPKSTTVDLPCGVADGTRLRVPGAGDAPLLRRTLPIRPEMAILSPEYMLQGTQFSREDDKIVIKHDIWMTTAALLVGNSCSNDHGQNIAFKITSRVQSGTDHSRERSTY